MSDIALTPPSEAHWRMYQHGVTWRNSGLTSGEIILRTIGMIRASRGFQKLASHEFTCKKRRCSDRRPYVRYWFKKVAGGI